MGSGGFGGTAESEERDGVKSSKDKLVASMDSGVAIDSELLQVASVFVSESSCKKEICISNTHSVTHVIQIVAKHLSAGISAGYTMQSEADDVTCIYTILIGY